MVVFFLEFPERETHSTEFGPNSMWTMVFDSKSGKWRDGPSWEGGFSTDLTTWVWHGLVYFVFQPPDHFEIWSMDPDSDRFQQVTGRALIPPLLEFPRCVPFNTELVVRRHNGVQSIDIASMMSFTMDQEAMEFTNPGKWARRFEEEPWDWHLRVWSWNSASGTWIARKEVTPDNVSSAKTPADWEVQDVFAYRGYHEHFGQVRVCRTDTLEECRYIIDEEGLVVEDIEVDVMLFHPRINFRP